MTRLCSEDISYIRQNLRTFDRTILRLTNMDLKNLAHHAAGVRIAMKDCQFESILFGIVPITSGQGLILGFSETVASIVEHLGFHVHITKERDVAGIAEAYKKSALIIMLADDQRFVVINRFKGTIIDNGEATARGFVVALSAMAKGLEGKTVFVLGCGNVGCHAALALIEGGAKLVLFDIDRTRAEMCAEWLNRSKRAKVTIESKIPSTLPAHTLIFDATPAEGIIHESFVSPQTLAACPGFPNGLTEGASKKLHGKFLHDPLMIGVATMAMGAAFGLAPIQWSKNEDYV